MMRTVFRVMRDMKTMQFFWLLVAGYIYICVDIFCMNNCYLVMMINYKYSMAWG